MIKSFRFDLPTKNEQCTKNYTNKFHDFVIGFLPLFSQSGRKIKNKTKLKWHNNGRSFISF